MNKVLNQKMHPKAPVFMIVIPSLGVGGTEKQVVLLASELMKKSISFEILAFRGGNYEDIFKRLKLPYLVLNTDQNFGFAFNISIWFKGLFYVLKKRPNYLDAFLPEAAIFGSLAKILSLGRIKLIVNRRSSVDYRKKHFLSSKLDTFSSRCADFLTVNSLTLKSEIAQFDKVNYSSICLTPNLVDLPSTIREFSDARINRILCVANFENRKGHIYLLEAIKILNSRNLFPVLNLVGRGSLLSQLQKYVQDNNLKNVSFIIDLNNCGDEYLESSIFVLPSLSEGMSNSLLEAMSYGLPCVGTTVSGTREILDGCGILVPPKNAEQLANAIESLLRDPSTSYNIGRAGKERLLKYSKNKEMVNFRINLHATKDF